MSTERPDLFAPIDPASPGRQARIGGGHESMDSMGGGFRAAADYLAQVWLDSPQDYRSDQLALPVLYLYRHAIELLLKHSCRETANLVTRGSRIGYGDVNTVPANLEKRLNSTHSIAQLVELFDSLVVGLAAGRDRLGGKTAEVLATLHDWDTAGMAFRYPHELDRKTHIITAFRPDEKAVDFQSGTTKLREAAQILDYGVGGFLDAYLDFLQDMESEYASNIS